MQPILLRLAGCALLVLQMTGCAEPSGPVRDGGPGDNMPGGDPRRPIDVTGLNDGVSGARYAVESRREREQRDLAKSYREEAVKATDAGQRERYLQIAEQIEDQLRQ